MPQDDAATEHAGGHGNAAMATHTTLHCLSGCVIGEVAGLMIGTALGLGVWLTLGLATVLAYISGFSIGLIPLMRAEGLGFFEALRMIWLGEAVSIGAMEIGMNGTDYLIGGVQSGSVMSPTFWIAIAVAVPVGFLAAWPVNYWLLKRGLRAGH